MPTAARVGVRRMLTVGIDEAASEEAIAAADAHEAVFAAVGRHPNGTSGFDDAAAARIEELAGHRRVAAVGETGLDYYRDTAPREEQRHAFRAQIGIARRVAKPLVIHVRDGGTTTDGEALEETFEILRAEATGVTVILHCFSAPAIGVIEAAEWGWYCSFAGNLTYPKSDALREAAADVPDDLLLVETDAPFLSPQPVRGKRNQPANVVATAEALADVRGVSYRSSRRWWRRTRRECSDGEAGGQNFLADTNLLERDRPRGGAGAETWSGGRRGEGALTARARAAGRGCTSSSSTSGCATARGGRGRARQTSSCTSATRCGSSSGARPAPTRMVANLPYSIATPLLIRTIDELPGRRSWTLMVQREIADRLRAAPGSRTYGSPSVLVQLACEVRLLRPSTGRCSRPARASTRR